MKQLKTSLRQTLLQLPGQLGCEKLGSLQKQAEAMAGNAKSLRIDPCF